MTQLSADLGNHARPHAVELDGRRYEFRHFGLPQMAEWERERYRLEREALRELKDDYGQEEYVKRLDAVRERYERHEFAFQSDEAFNRSARGILMLVRALTGLPDEEAWAVFNRAPEEVGQLMDVIVRESFPKAGAGQGPARGTSPPASAG